MRINDGNKWEEIDCVGGRERRGAVQDTYQDIRENKREDKGEEKGREIC